jgi:hypothetical protein
MGSVVKETGRANPIGMESERSGAVETQQIQRSTPTQKPSMDEFVGEQNISRFVDQFQIAHDQQARQTLQKLLLEEMNRFGLNLEQLRRIEKRINECKAHIDQHERLIQKARINGHDVRTAERALNNLIELQEIFWSYHQVVLEAVNRRRL